MPTFSGMGFDGGALADVRFHHSKTETWPSALADSSARSLYLSGRPDSYHHSRTLVNPAREAPSMASATYCFVERDWESLHQVSIAGLP